MSIYSALGISEVWRFDGQTIRIHLLRPDGQYEESPQSLSFPTLPVNEFAQFIQETAGLWRGRPLDQGISLDWARQHVPPLVPEMGNGS